MPCLIVSSNLPARLDRGANGFGVATVLQDAEAYALSSVLALNGLREVPLGSVRPAGQRHTTQTTVINPPRGVAVQLNICRSAAIIFAQTSQ
jgi:hypothetical protein